MAIFGNFHKVLNQKHFSNALQYAYVHDNFLYVSDGYIMLKSHLKSDWGINTLFNFALDYNTLKLLSLSKWQKIEFLADNIVCTDKQGLKHTIGYTAKEISKHKYHIGGKDIEAPNFEEVLDKINIARGQKHYINVNIKQLAIIQECFKSELVKICFTDNDKHILIFPLQNDSNDTVALMITSNN